MTSRGNPSISPPAQISQQRHGNALPSGTPPPQQYYPGQSPALPQAAYEFIAPQQPLLPYQAYGSAVNELRSQTGSVRSGPVQAPGSTMHQTGGGPAAVPAAAAAHYYQHQPGGPGAPGAQNIRPQHPQQPGQVNQQYYISAGQNNMRPPRAHHPNQSQAMVYIPQTFPGNNVVIAAHAQNMYQPRAQMSTYYTPVPQSTYPALYIPNGAGATWRGPSMPQAGPAAQARPREKKVIKIEDPTTGKDLTEELINSAHQEHATEPEEEAQGNQSGQEIGKLFTRLVADRLNKPSEDAGASASSVDNQQPGMGGAPPQAPGQQYQQPPPPPTSQQMPPPMMRGPPRMPPPTHMMPPRPGMMPQQQVNQPKLPQQQQQQPPQQHPIPPATPPHQYPGAGAEMGHPQMVHNFSMPPPQLPPQMPPQLRQPTPAQVYNTAQQQQQHMVRHPQQQQPPAQAMRPPVVMTAPQPPVQQQQPQPQPQTQQPPVQQTPLQQPQQQSAQQQQQPQSTSQPDQPTLAPLQGVPSSAPAAATPAVSAEQPSQPVPPQPAQTAPAPVKAPSPPAKEETATPVPTAQPQKDVSAQQEAEEAGKAPDSKEEALQGASNRGAKDGRKGKKNKRDLNTKEIGGSDMDAFIDSGASKEVPKLNGTRIATSEEPAVASRTDADPQQNAPSKRDPRNPWNLKPAQPVRPEVFQQGADFVIANFSANNENKTASSAAAEQPSNAENTAASSSVAGLLEETSGSSAPQESPVPAASSESSGSPTSGSTSETTSPSEEFPDKSLGDSPTQVKEKMEEEEEDRALSSQAKSKLVKSAEGAAAAQVEPKHKLKKKKKKKGRKSPPLSKNKPAPTEEKENESTTSKPPLPPSAASIERNTPTEMTAAASVSQQQEVKPAAQQTPVKQENPAATVAPPAPAPAVPAETPATEDNVKEMPLEPPPAEAAPQKTPSEAVVDVKAPVEPAPPVQKSTPAVTSVPEDDSKKMDAPAVSPAAPTTKNQNQPQQLPEGQDPRPVSEGEPSSLNDVPSSDSVSKPVSSSSQGAGKNDKTDKSDATPQTPVNDENIPPTDSSLSRPKIDDERRAPPPLRDDDGDGPTKPPSEKLEATAKKDGKDQFKYDRAYLMELRECASSQTKPEGLPNLEIILDRPVNRAASGTSPDFTPTFFQHNTPQRHPQQMGKSASRGRGRPGEMQVPQRIIKSVSIQNDVKALHQSEKPWKPSQKQLATGEISGKDENLEKKALFIMNRITPTNFEPLSGEMLGLKVGEFDQLKQLVKIFFDKVTLETKFVEAYAKLCKKMCSLKVPPPPGMKENQATFRVLLLTKCQTEFESDKAVVFEDPEEKRKKLEAELPEGPDKKEQIETTLYHMKLRRLKFYGNIRFIGELFKLNMLTENIMHDCIYRLLKARDDESLLSLCQLISTVGSILDTDKAKQRMDQYFAQMTKIAEERKSRIKFTLKDAIDLRRNNWVPRKETTGPKKIDEVRQDFHQEQQTKQFLQNQPPPPRNEPQPGSRRGSRQRQEEKPNDDGWNTVGSKSLRIDASKMKFSKNVVDENNIQLGPGGGMNKFSMWSRGSGAAQPPQDSPANRPANRFSALPSDDDRRFTRSPSRGDSGGVMNRGLRQGNTAGHGRGKIMGRSSIEGERRDVLASARSIVGGRSQNSSRDNSWNREDRRSLGPRGSREGESSMGPPRTINLRPSTERSSAPPPVAQAPAPATGGFGAVKKAAPKTEEEMEHSAKTIMDEYLNIRDLKEAKLCVMELEGQKFLYLFVTAAINNVLERSDKDRINTGQFFAEIVKDNLISVDKFIKGLSEVLQFAEDMVIDIPKMWTNLAQMVTPLLVGGSMPWTQLKPTLEQHLTPMCSAKLLAEIFIFAKGTLSEAEVARVWQTSGLTWEAFLPADQVANFIKDKKLEFLQQDCSGPGASKLVNPDGVVSDLVKIILDNTPNSDLHTYIMDKVPRDVDEKSFVRLLMTAVSKASLSPTMKANVEVIANRQEVLQKYIKTPELELQALYAIQALMHRLEHPGGVIANLFDALYNEEVISEEAFKQWEESSEEPEGKGACILQLTQFFAWLRENEDIETS